MTTLNEVLINIQTLKDLERDIDQIISVTLQNEAPMRLAYGKALIGKRFGTVTDDDIRTAREQLSTIQMTLADLQAMKQALPVYINEIADINRTKNQEARRKQLTILRAEYETRIAKFDIDLNTLIKTDGLKQAADKLFDIARKAGMTGEVRKHFKEISGHNKCGFLADY